MRRKRNTQQFFVGTFTARRQLETAVRKTRLPTVCRFPVLMIGGNVRGTLADGKSLALSFNCLARPTPFSLIATLVCPRTNSTKTVQFSESFVSTRTSTATRAAMLCRISSTTLPMASFSTKCCPFEEKSSFDVVLTTTCHLLPLPIAQRWAGSPEILRRATPRCAALHF